MNSSLIFLLLLQVVLIFLNAVFASAEIAVLSINETKLERMAQEGNNRAKRLFRLTREPARFLATIQVAITLSGFLGSAFAADNFSEPLVDWILSLGVNIPRATLDAAAVIVITLVLSYFTLIFGELVPKRIAMKKPEQLAMGISGLVSGISIVFKPVVSFLSISTNLVLRLCGIDPNEEEEKVSEEEIRMMVDAGSEKGTIDHQEKEFIQNVFEFNDIMVESIATHRTDVTILWMEEDMDSWAETIHNSRHTRYPVCDGSPDNVVGVLNAKDYFRLEDKSRENVLQNAVYPAYFVLETTKADVLFKNMKANKKSMAIIIDEYGGMTGIVTLYDLIEELVGDLEDEPLEYKNDDPYIEKVDENTWQVKGNVELEDIEEALKVEIASAEFDTFTGLVFEELGRIPEDGEQDINLKIQDIQVHISSVKDHQIEKAEIKISAKEEKDAEVKIEESSRR
ncbi:hemolysin family protein [Blautia sp.]|uniref:Magnesium and cobalt efflux protein CorC n=1 Tax=Blautia glucerasea TaxID=536633 RepID=A0A6N2UUQ8_9FIRM